MARPPGGKAVPRYMWKRADAPLPVVVPPERIELSSLAPEASTLSAELRGHFGKTRISRPKQADKTRGRKGNPH